MSESGHDKMLERLHKALIALGEAQQQSHEAVASHLAAETQPTPAQED